MKGIPLVLENVTRHYRRGQETVQALRDISLTFYPGQLTLVLGPSGGGKSSLLHVLGGMDRPSNGRIMSGSTDITRLRPDELAKWRRRTIGFVFQSFHLLPGQTAVDNAALPLLLDGQNPGSRRLRAREILSNLGLADRLNHKPSELSGGQIQRVAIARALAHDPPVILADEPTGNLDTQSGQDIMKQLQELAHEDGRTVIVVSHNEEYIPLVDRVVRVRDGLIESDSLQSAPPLPPGGNQQTTVRAKGGPSLAALFGEAFRSLGRRKGRSLLTSLGVTIGVTSMVLLVSIGAGLQAHVIKSILGATSLNAINVSPNQTPAGISFTPQLTHGKSHPIYPSTIRLFQRMPHVKGAYGMSSFLVSLSTPKGSMTTMISPRAPSGLQGTPAPHLIVGKLPTRRHPGVVLPESIATKIFAVKPSTLSKALGQSMTVRVQSIFGMGGAIQQTHFTKTVRLPLAAVMKNSLGQNGYINYSEGQTWLNQMKGPHHRITYMTAVVYATSTSHVKSIANAIRAKGFGVTTTQSIIQQVQHGFGMVETGLGIVGGIALAVAGLMIGVVMSMAVLERRREIGIWRAVGARRRDVFVLFLIEAVTMGLFGGALGDLLGWGLGTIGVRIFHHPGLFLVQPWLVLLGLAFGGGIAAVAGMIPANHAARLNPVDALKTE